MVNRIKNCCALGTFLLRTCFDSSRPLLALVKIALSSSKRRATRMVSFCPPDNPHQGAILTRAINVYESCTMTCELIVQWQLWEEEPILCGPFVSWSMRLAFFISFRGLDADEFWLSGGLRNAHHYAAALLHCASSGSQLSSRQPLSHPQVFAFRLCLSFIKWLSPLSSSCVSIGCLPFFRRSPSTKSTLFS